MLELQVKMMSAWFHAGDSLRSRVRDEREDRGEVTATTAVARQWHGTTLRALRVGVGRGDPRLVPGVRSWLRFLWDCSWKEPLACRTVSRW